MERKFVFDTQDIQRLLAHRYPLLLVDRVIEFTAGERMVTIKNVTVNEEFFVGHFPGEPVMPGVLIMEAMAQSAALLYKASAEADTTDAPGFRNAERRAVLLVGANGFKWKKRVVPGDTLWIEVAFKKSRPPLWIVESTATVDGVEAAKGTLSAMATEI